MTTCKHKTSTVQAEHGNVQLSECDWGCGAILISITGDDGITRTMTADEAWELSRQVEVLSRCTTHALNFLQSGIISNDERHRTIRTLKRWQSSAVSQEATE